MKIEHFALTSVYCPLYSVRCPLSTILCLLYNVHYTLSTVHCPLAPFVWPCLCPVASKMHILIRTIHCREACCTPVQCSVLDYSAVQCSAQLSVVQSSAVQCTALIYNVQYFCFPQLAWIYLMTQCSAVQCSAGT